MAKDGERARHVAAILSSIRNSSVEELLAELECRWDNSRDDTVTLGPFNVFQLNSAAEEASDVETVEIRTVPESAGDVLKCYPIEQLFDALNREQAFDETLCLSPGTDVCQSTGALARDFEAIEGSALVMDDISLLLPPTMPITYSFNVEDLDFPTIRLLLDRYQHALVPYFSPARIHSKSPWETLHIPKVYETLGEFMVRGDAGNSKVSLLFAVLGASAFHLDILLPTSETAMLPWRVIGENYRSQAKTRLKVSLQSLSSGRKVEDYQDVLMALLSMVTLCVCTKNGPTANGS